MVSLPRALLHLEGALVATAAVVAYAHVGYGWTFFALAILAPDLSMIGYLAGPRIGSYAYDAAHFYGWPLALAGLAFVGGGPAWVLPAALVWATHIGADRALGYGLKYATGFKDTHLQRA